MYKHPEKHYLLKWKTPNRENVRCHFIIIILMPGSSNRLKVI